MRENVYAGRSVDDSVAAVIGDVRTIGRGQRGKISDGAVNRGKSDRSADKDGQRYFCQNVIEKNTDHIILFQKNISLSKNRSKRDKKNSCSPLKRERPERPRVGVGR